MLQIIKNIDIFEGIQGELVRRDIAVEDGYIKAIGSNLPTTGAYTIDGHNNILSPGFIDCHGHSDMSIIACPEATGKISQGITTEIIGNCGLSLFPITDINRERLGQLYEHYNQKITWRNLREYAYEVNRRKPAINLAAFCGHNTLRAAVVGYEKQNTSSAEIELMRNYLSEEIKNGAIGISTGLIYVPGKFSSSEELTSLLSICGKSGGIYATHIRNEGDAIEDALTEAIQISLNGKVKLLHISHLKIAGKNNWNKINTILSIITEGKNQGLYITADRYPYIESLTQLSIILPSPFDKYDDATLKIKLRNEEEYASLVKALNSYPATKWKEIRLISTNNKEYKKYEGTELDKIADKSALPPSEICAELIKTDSTNTLAAFKGMSEDNMKTIISLPYVCCGTDEVARPLDFRIGKSHPRGFGSFPRFIKLLIAEDKTNYNSRLCDALYRITALPARIFKLHKRGYLKPGFYADMVLFNPDELLDTATFAVPHSLPKGIKKVWVNGNLSCDEDNLHISANGTFLY